ncbi:MAG: DNA polymerase III subunit delta [Chloroflexi bacterium]|nr:DNA polymerase III subunit delta [Chloroflexota bacterium]
MFYLFHGSDELGKAELLADMRTRLFAADPMAELNYGELDGRRLDLGELHAAAEALPFIGDRRMVVVRGLVERCNPRGGDAGRKALAEGLIALMGGLPPTTRLVLLDAKLHGNNPVLKWAQTWLSAQPAPDAAGLIRLFDPPSPNALPSWLGARAKARGGRIEPAAASSLADALVQDGQVNLHLADNELEKLLTYADGRAVGVDDVALLVTPIGLDSIFAFVDSLGRRDGPGASSMLHRFLDNGEAPLRILAMVARQFRLLALTQALGAEGVAGSELPRRLSLPPFVANKLSGQASRFSARFLDAALRRLRDIDTEIKTGRIAPDLALDLFVAGVCGARSAEASRTGRG